VAGPAATISRMTTRMNATDIPEREADHEHGTVDFSVGARLLEQRTVSRGASFEMTDATNPGRETSIKSAVIPRGGARSFPLATSPVRRPKNLHAGRTVLSAASDSARGASVSDKDSSVGARVLSVKMVFRGASLRMTAIFQTRSFCGFGMRRRESRRHPSPPALLFLPACSARCGYEPACCVGRSIPAARRQMATNSGSAVAHWRARGSRSATTVATKKPTRM
jgi:hypothetical protein